MTQRSKVAILGTAPSLVAAPLADPSFDLWTMNGSWTVAPKSDAHFEMHRHDRAGFARVYGQDYVDWMAGRTAPTQMLEAHDWIPSSRRFPIEALTEKFGEMWGSTPCYALALAVVKGYSEIALCGIEMIGKAEGKEAYTGQRETVQYFRGVALGRGVKVTFPGGSALEARSVRYGYQEPQLPQAALDAAEREFDLAEQQRANADSELLRAVGAVGALESLFSTGALKGAAEKAARKIAAQAQQAGQRATAARLEAEGAMASAARVQCALKYVAAGGAA